MCVNITVQVHVVCGMVVTEGFQLQSWFLSALHDVCVCTVRCHFIDLGITVNMEMNLSSLWLLQILH